MKLIKYLLLLIAILLGNSSFAQNSNQAKVCLDRATAIVATKGGVSARFSLSNQQYGNISGTISIKGQKFVASTPQTTVWFDGRTQWSYMKSTNEVNISTPTEAQRLSMNPYSLMSMYRQGYRLSMTVSGASYVVHMKATNTARSIQEAYVTVSKGYQLQAIRMRQGKKWTTIKVTGIQKKNLPDAIFKFNKKKYPSAEVIDLR